MSKLSIAAICATLVVVSVAFCRHDASLRADGEIARRDSIIEQKNVVIDSLAKIAVAHDANVGAALATFAKRDTVWRTFVDTMPLLLDIIVHDTVSADSARIDQLAMLVLRTRFKADSVIRAAEVLADSIARLRAAFAVERHEWTDQRATMTAQIAAVKQQARRWGLTASLGYDPLDLNLHKPRLNLGVGVIY